MANVISCTVYPVNGGTIGTQGIGVAQIKRVYAQTRSENAAIVTAIALAPTGSTPAPSATVLYTNSTVSAIITACNA
jgi:hypothetical protein